MVVSYSNMSATETKTSGDRKVVKQELDYKINNLLTKLLLTMWPLRSTLEVKFMRIVKSTGPMKTLYGAGECLRDVSKMIFKSTLKPL